jgi:hypothetical protein
MSANEAGCASDKGCFHEDYFILVFLPDNMAIFQTKITAISTPIWLTAIMLSNFHFETEGIKSSWQPRHIRSAANLLTQVRASAFGKMHPKSSNKRATSEPVDA